jgi:hypothetical protein
VPFKEGVHVPSDNWTHASQFVQILCCFAFDLAHALGSRTRRRDEQKRPVTFARRGELFSLASGAVRTLV